MDRVGHIAVSGYGLCEVFSPEEEVNLISTLPVNELPTCTCRLEM
jgi:hypothetical protein